MSPSNTIRSFAISLAIVILITESPTNGFTIRRTKNTTTETDRERDLSTEESLNLEVRTLKRPNGMYVIDSKNEEEKKEILNNKLSIKNASTDLSNENETRMTSQDKNVTNNDVILSSPKGDVEETTLTLNTTEASTTIKNEENNNNKKVTEDQVFNISQLTTEEATLSSLKSVNKSTVGVNLTNIETTTETQNVLQTVTNSTTTRLSEESKNKESETTITPGSTYTEKSPETTPNAKVTNTSVYVSSKNSENDTNSIIHNDHTNLTSSDLIAKENTNIENKENLNLTDNMLHFTVNVNYNMTPEASETFKTEVKTSNKLNNITKNDINSTANSIFAAEIETKNSQIQSNSTTSNTDIVITTRQVNLVSELQNLEKNIVNQSRTSSVGPSWKKYTIIDRKRTSITTENPTTKKEDEMMKAETLQTRISLDKVLTYTPIPSLEKLREDLLSIANQPSSKIQKSKYSTEQSVNNILEINSTTSPLMSTESVITKKVDIVSTKRAGFLDNSAKTTPIDVTTFANLENKNINHTITYGTRQENETLDSDGQQYRNATGVESLSQLVEDAIKEELLKEKTLNDHEENKEKRYRDVIVEVNGFTEKPKSVVDNSEATQEIGTEYTLNVQPISQDKIKNTSLYTVSSKYKPMKKIDVQPPKQFVRHPDDNSWRNESISSLGIVFKPKNSSKSFTQVLKNKTETELSTLLDKESKSGTPELRQRLEKITEVRKSKKKRIDKFGEVVYTDYEESNASGEGTSTSKIETTSAIITSSEITFSTATTSPTLLTFEPETTLKSNTSTENVKIHKVNTTTTESLGIFNYEKSDTLTTQKPKKFYNIAEYYDTTDDYDADYIKLSKIDIKKFTTPPQTTETSVAPPVELQTKPIRNYLLDRKPTIQYFPPRKPAKTKVNINGYDDQFQRKVNLYTLKEAPRNTVQPTIDITPTDLVATDKPEEQNRQLLTPETVYKSGNLNKNLYLTHAPRVTEPHNGFAANDGNFNRASYVIKHYRDFIDQAAKDDDERHQEYVHITESPMRGVTMNDLVKVISDKDKPTLADNYDYDQQLRKDILNRFVDNFNQNSDRFKVDFPILYNSSVVHRKFDGNGKVMASSSAFMKRLYDAATKPNFLLKKKFCEPNCDNMTVELSPAYELHYYVPDQEEKEEAIPTESPMPYRYRL